MLEPLLRLVLGSSVNKSQSGNCVRQRHVHTQKYSYKVNAEQLCSLKAFFFLSKREIVKHHPSHNLNNSDTELNKILVFLCLCLSV